VAIYKNTEKITCTFLNRIIFVIPMSFGVLLSKITLFIIISNKLSNLLGILNHLFLQTL